MFSQLTLRLTALNIIPCTLDPTSKIAYQASTSDIDYIDLLILVRQPLFTVNPNFRNRFRGHTEVDTTCSCTPMQSNVLILACTNVYMSYILGQTSYIGSLQTNIYIINYINQLTNNTQPISCTLPYRRLPAPAHRLGAQKNHCRQGAAVLSIVGSEYACSCGPYMASTISRATQNQYLCAPPERTLCLSQYDITRDIDA